MPILIAQNLTTEDVHLGDLYTKVPKPQNSPCGPHELGIITTFRSSSELMRSPALHKAIADGKLAIAIQFTSDEVISQFDPWPGLRAYGTNLVVKNHGATLTSTADSIDFTGPGVVASAIGDDVTVNVTASGSGSTLSVDTTGAAANRLCYLSALAIAVMTDAAAFVSSVVVGVYQGTAGELQTQGVVTLEFSTASAVPVPGKLVFIERADAEIVNEAVGKARIAPIVTTGFVVPVGVVTDIAADYATSHLASVQITLPGLRITRVGG